VFHVVLPDSLLLFSQIIFLARNPHPESIFSRGLSRLDERQYFLVDIFRLDKASPHVTGKCSIKLILKVVSFESILDFFFWRLFLVLGFIPFRSLILTINPLFKVINFCLGQFLLSQLQIRTDFHILSPLLSKKTAIKISNKVQQKVSLLTEFSVGILVAVHHEIALTEFKEVEVAVEMG
jgi:hypothetical protein